MRKILKKFQSSCTLVGLRIRVKFLAHKISVLVKKFNNFDIIKIKKGRYIPYLPSRKQIKQKVYQSNSIKYSQSSPLANFRANSSSHVFFTCLTSYWYTFILFPSASR